MLSSERWGTVLFSTLGTLAFPVLVGAFLYSCWVRGKKVCSWALTQFRQLKRNLLTPGSTSKPNKKGASLSWGGTLKMIREGFCWLSQQSPLLLLAGIGLSAVSAGYWFLKWLPTSVSGALVGVGIISMFVFVMSMVTRPALAKDLPLNAIPILVGLVSYGALIVITVMVIAPAVKLSFGWVFVALVLYLVPFLLLVKSILGGAIRSTLKPVVVLTAIVCSLSFILLVLGLFNLSASGEIKVISDSSATRLLFRVMNYGAATFYNLKEPTLTGPLAPFAQYFLGSVFLSLIIGSLASSVSDMFSGSSDPKQGLEKAKPGND